MATLLTEQAVAEMLAGAQPVPPPQAVQAPTPQQMFNLPSPIPQTRFFGGRTSSSRYSDPFTQQERYRKAVMEQMADQQTEALWNELKVTPPDAPDAPARRLQLLTQYPLSQQSEVGKTILSAWDKEAERFHKGVTDDKSADLISKLAVAGATDAEIQSVYDSSGRVNSVAAGRMLGDLTRLQEKAKKAEKTEKTEQERMDEEIKNLRELVDTRFKMGTGNKKEDELFLGRLRELENRRFGIGTAPAAPAAPSTSVAPTIPGLRPTSVGNAYRPLTPTPAQ
jgi:hypothetical protein